MQSSLPADPQIAQALVPEGSYPPEASQLFGSASPAAARYVRFMFRFVESAAPVGLLIIMVMMLVPPAVSPVRPKVPLVRHPAVKVGSASRPWTTPTVSPDAAATSTVAVILFWAYLTSAALAVPAKRMTNTASIAVLVVIDFFLILYTSKILIRVLL